MPSFRRLRRLPDGISALRDSPGELGYRTAFGIGHAGLRLVRPDGYIGLRASAEQAHVALAGVGQGDGRRVGVGIVWRIAAMLS